jgi:hypothetical protein
MIDVRQKAKDLHRLAIDDSPNGRLVAPCIGFVPKGSARCEKSCKVTWIMAPKDAGDP